MKRHNLNLAHSGGLDGQTYTDHTCLVSNLVHVAICSSAFKAKLVSVNQMGNPLYSDDVVKM
jgi:hypothetical protein